MSHNEPFTDELLVVHAQEGSAEAFEQLVERWQERLWRFAWRLTGDEQAAWDVSQETWTAISRRIRRLEDAAAFPAWVYQITSNKSRDWIRRQQRRRRADEQYVERRTQSDEERQEVERQFASLKETLDAMPSEDRTILSLRYEAGFSTKEIAEILEIPAGTVKSRLHYARERLRHFLELDNHE